MADLPVSVSHGLSFHEHGVAVLPPAGCDVELEDDFLIFDGLEEVDYRQKGTKEVNDAGIQTETGNKGATIENALRRWVSDRDLRQAEGFIKVGDTKWQLPREELDFEPKIGDELTDGTGTVWRVIGFGDMTLKTRWEIFARS